jgi:hypothetical protein
MPAAVRLTPLTTASIHRASRLEPASPRSLDAIHLDAAIELHRAGMVDAPLPTTSSSAPGAAITHYGTVAGTVAETAAVTGQRAPTEARSAEHLRGHLAAVAPHGTQR